MSCWHIVTVRIAVILLTMTSDLSHSQLESRITVDLMLCFSFILIRIFQRKLIFCVIFAVITSTVRLGSLIVEHLSKVCFLMLLIV